MSLVSTRGLYLPHHPGIVVLPSLTPSVIDATGEKIAFMGRVWTPSRGTKSIRNISFRFGTVTKAGGSALTVSLQDVSLTSGPPMQPDGTQDQTVAIANADAQFVSSSYYTTGNLSADRSIAFGELVAVVVEYDGAGRLGADSIGFNNALASSASIKNNAEGVSLLTASWADQTTAPNILFTFSDGTFGTFFNSNPFTLISTTNAFNSGSAADERALEFQVPFDCKVDGIWAVVLTAASADFDVVLYDEASNVLAAVSIDANAVMANAGHLINVPIAETSLTRNTTYRLALKPTTANSITNYEASVANSAHFSVWPGGEAFKLATRADGGAWTTTASARPFMGLSVSQVHDAAGGGLLAHPGMRGGMI